MCVIGAGTCIHKSGNVEEAVTDDEECAGRPSGAMVPEALESVSRQCVKIENISFNSFSSFFLGLIIV